MAKPIHEALCPGRSLNREYLVSYKIKDKYFHMSDQNQLEVHKLTLYPSRSLI